MKPPTPALDRTRLVLAATLLLAGGCNANHVLGVGDGGASPGSAGAAGTSAPGSAGASAIGNIDASAAGSAGTTGVAGAGGAAGIKADPTTLGPEETWTGYVENRKFPSGSDAIVLKFATDANGVTSGTIIFGMGTPPPPATDPDVGYPPDLLGQSGGPAVAQMYVAEGYPYTFDGGSLVSHRLRFMANLSQLWAGWCALQTPPSDGTSSCLPNWGSMASGTMCAETNPQTHKAVPVDCGRLWLCFVLGGPCACTSAGCGLGQDPIPATFDAFLNGDTANGSVLMNAVGMANVHLVKN